MGGGGGGGGGEGGESRGTCLISSLFMVSIDIFLCLSFFLIFFFQVMLFLGGLVACYMLSVVVSLAFEAPMMALEKAVLGRSKRD